MSSSSSIVPTFKITSGQLPSTINHDSSTVYIVGDKFKGLSYVRRVASLLWFSYRKAFGEPVPGTSYTSDSGWGCTHRSTQMLLAVALCRLLLGREFRLVKGRPVAPQFLQVLRWFADCPRAPFSVHRIAAAAAVGGHFQLGDWIGPASASAALKELCRQFRPDHRAQQLNLCVHLVNHGLIYLDQIASYFQGDDAASSLLILCPCRLGLHKMDPSYAAVLKAWFRIPFCVGLIGGSLHSSLYFCGYAEDSVVYLDPHTVQKSVNMPPDQHFPINSFRSAPCAMPLSEVDVSLSVGFLLESADDIEALAREIRVAAAYSQLFSLTCESKAPVESTESQSTPEQKEDEEGFLLL